MKTLIVYSSGFGTTREISEKIANFFVMNSTITVDLKSIDQIENIKSYESVIIGSSIRADKPMANTRDFLSLYHQQLARKRVAIFLVSLSAITAKGRNKVLNEFLPILLEGYPEIKPIEIGILAGKIDFEKLNPVMQNLVRYIIAKLDVPVKGSLDARNWKHIEQWSESVLKKISTSTDKI